jgi:hypothetical protein
MSTLTCAACNTEKDDDWVICEYCQLFTLKRLREIPKLHILLSKDEWLKMPEKIESERRARSTSGGAPANLHVLSLLDKRTDIRAVLTPWVEEINERLNLNTGPPADVRGLCDRVISLLPWCASHHPAAGDLVSEVKQGHDMLVQVVKGTRRAPKPVKCPVVLPEEGPCQGVLHLQGDGSVSCRACGSVWPYESWQRLGSLLAT